MPFQATVIHAEEFMCGNVRAASDHPCPYKIHESSIRLRSLRLVCYKSISFYGSQTSAVVESLTVRLGQNVINCLLDCDIN